MLWLSTRAHRFQGLKSFVDDDDEDGDDEGAGEAEAGENVSRDVPRDAGSALANLIVQSQTGSKITGRDALTRVDDFTDVNRRKMALNEQVPSSSSRTLETTSSSRFSCYPRVLICYLQSMISVWKL